MLARAVVLSVAIALSVAIVLPVAIVLSVAIVRGHQPQQSRILLLNTALANNGDDSGDAAANAPCL